MSTMNRRTHATPMEFEWDQPGGPSDPTSPFAQLAQQKSIFNQDWRSPSRPEQSASSIFAGNSATTATPFRNPSFTTPRKPFDSDLFSEDTGAESSPGDAADIDDTPDPPNKTVPSANTFGLKKPIFERYGRDFKNNIAARTELRRLKFANDSIVSKTRKRRRVERDHYLVGSRRANLDSDNESNGSRPNSSHSQAQKSQGWISKFFDGIEARPDLPYLLSYYPQMFFSYAVLAFVIYLVYCFFSAIRADVDKASEQAMAEVLAEMAKCAKDYTENLCGADKRLPAMETMCLGWERCMNKDPYSVGRARVSAHTFAEIFNSFVEPISWKAMAFIVVIFSVCIGVNNFAFNSFRSQAHQPPAPKYFAPTQPAQDHFQQWGVPQTPRHVQDHDVYGESFKAIMPSQTPGQRSPRKTSRN